jgi:hypothetical protein
MTLFEQAPRREAPAKWLEGVYYFEAWGIFDAMALLDVPLEVYYPQLGFLSLLHAPARSRRRPNH